MPAAPEYPSPENLVAPGESPETAAVYADWSNLVQRIRSGETDGVEELYQLFSSGIYLYLLNRLGPRDLENKLSRIFAAVAQGIRDGELQRPERLFGFVRRTVREQMSEDSHELLNPPEDGQPKRQSAEALAFRKRIELMKQVLKELGARDREILSRFYLQEQSQEQICAEMSLTEIQFRLLLTGVKSRFASLREAISSGQTRNGQASIDLNILVPVVAHAVLCLGMNIRRLTGSRLRYRCWATDRLSSCLSAQTAWISSNKS